MNNDNDDDRDTDAAAARTPSSPESGTFRKEPTFSMFDNDTELEVDDIEAEDFATDYVAEGYDDEPFDDDDYTDETDETDSAADDEKTPVDDPIGSLWIDDGSPELDERPAEQSERTPWDDEPETTVTKSQSLDVQDESLLAQDALASATAAGIYQRDKAHPHTRPQEDDVDDPVAPEDELPLEYAEEDPDDERWEDEIDDDDDDDYEYTEEPQKLPVGLIIVALVALALLAAGGYGIIKERAAAEAELTELRARLATAVNQQDIAAERDRASSLESENARLLAQLDALTDDNTDLSAKVESLQQQLEKAATPATAAPVVAKVTPQQALPSTPTPTSTSTNTAAGNNGTAGWFVNFGSYSQRAKAQEWADRLKPDSGRVIVAAADSPGGSIYRVRVIGLGSKADAQRIAAQLERAHDLPKLWVGQQ